LYVPGKRVAKGVAMNLGKRASKRMSAVAGAPQVRLDNPEIQEEIRRTAYSLYEKRGRKGGQELNDWLEAEKIVRRRFS
jgi:hypothetical protein